MSWVANVIDTANEGTELGILIYGIAIPAHLFVRLKKESQDEGDQRFDPEFMEAHGWMVRHP